MAFKILEPTAEDLALMIKSTAGISTKLTASILGDSVLRTTDIESLVKDYVDELRLRKLIANDSVQLVSTAALVVCLMGLHQGFLHIDEVQAASLMFSPIGKGATISQKLASLNTKLVSQLNKKVVTKTAAELWIIHLLSSYINELVGDISDLGNIRLGQSSYKLLNSAFLIQDEDIDAPDYRLKPNDIAGIWLAKYTCRQYPFWMDQLISNNGIRELTIRGGPKRRLYIEKGFKKLRQDLTQATTSIQADGLIILPMLLTKIPHKILISLLLPKRLEEN